MKARRTTVRAGWLGALVMTAGMFAFAGPAAAEERPPTTGELGDKGYSCGFNKPRTAVMCVRPVKDQGASVYVCPPANGPCQHVDGPPARRAPGTHVTPHQGGVLTQPK